MYMWELYRFLTPKVLYVTIPLVVVAMIIKLIWPRTVRYCYAPTAQLVHAGIKRGWWPWWCRYLLRVITLVILLISAAQLQKADPRSRVRAQGIDIELVLDVSGSMMSVDEGNYNKSRLTIAKEEAIRFVNKRTNDGIGLVIFGTDALSRCPITSDKDILISIINDLEIGVIDPRGTVLATSIVTAINRLYKSTAKSKVIILLTDGAPSEHDSDPQVAIEAAKACNIKIYTIGIGSDKEQYVMDPVFGLGLQPKVNKELLTFIAQSTGGKFFLARNKNDMRTIYDSIDQLEKIDHEVAYSNYFNIWITLLWIALFLVAMDSLLAAIWRWI
jgi:Ca-activated chloride channel family protein